MGSFFFQELVETEKNDSTSYQKHNLRSVFFRFGRPCVQTDLISCKENYAESTFVECSWRELAACSLLPEPLGLAQRVVPLLYIVACVTIH